MAFAFPDCLRREVSMDRDHNPILGKSGYMRLSDVPKENGQDVAHEGLFSPDIVIDVPGYVYIYLSNEEEAPLDVYFDDFKVEHVPSSIVQMDDYYPFGLTFNSYQRENSTENRYLYNQGTGEKTFRTERVFELDLNVDFSKYRVYDPAMGRWWQVDPKADEFFSLTPYNYSFNDPVRYNDPLGDCPTCPGFFVDLAIRAKLYYDRLSGATQRLASGGSGNIPSGAPVPNDVRQMQKALGTLNDTKVVAQTVVDAGEGAAQVVASIPGVETVGDVAGTFYYGAKGDMGSAAMHAVSIFIPAVSGSQIKAIGNFASESKLASHFKKHAAEFGEQFKNADEYLKGAQDFFNNITDDVAQFVRQNGDVVQYNAKSNEFGVIDKDGNIRTFFKPEKGQDYFTDQIKKEVQNGN